MKYFIGIDLGTSALKLLLVDEQGQVLNTVSKSYDVSYPNPGWSEQSPSDWWQALIDGFEDLTKGFDKSLIAAMGAAGQMHGLVILDEHDNVIRPAILWNDGRTFKETEYLNEVIGVENLSKYTANMAFAGFTAPKILWVKNNEPENFSKIEKIMLPKDYINYRLTGEFATDFSDAAGMLLVDVKNRKWSKEMLEICGIAEDKLPKLYESYEKIGTITSETAKLLGLNEDVVVVAGAGDNAAAAIGTATVGDGKCNISLGTSGTIFISSKEFCDLNNNAIHNFCHSDGGYHLMGCILSAASCNKWFCDKILNTNDYKTEESVITDDMLGSGDLFFLPYLMGERSPINDTDATGMFIGLRPNTTRKEMLLAVLEGVIFAIKDCLEIVNNCGANVKRSTICGGGAKSKLWRKITANVLNIPIDIPSAEEGPGMGGAVLAMVGSNPELSVSDLACEFTKITDTVLPDAEISARYQAKYEKFKKIYPAVKDLYKNLK
jgi:xylulokinase